jgi:hypothetical protein
MPLLPLFSGFVFNAIPILVIRILKIILELLLVFHNIRLIT